jgi:hypothetical protein
MSPYQLHKGKRQRATLADPDPRWREKIVCKVWTFKKWVENVVGLECLKTGLYSEMPLSAWEAEQMARQLVVHRQQEMETMRAVYGIQK